MLWVYENDQILEGGVDYAGNSPVNASDVQLAEDVAFIREYLEEQKEKQEQEIAEAEAAETTEEATTEEVTTEEKLTLLTSADNTLYLSSEVVYANTNDLYSILLSTRNILLLFFFTFLIFKVGVIFKNALAKLINR